MSTMVETILSSEPEIKKVDETIVSDHQLPKHSRAKATVFTVMVVLAAVANIACGILTYTIYTRGEILRDLYDTLVSNDVTVFVWIAAAVGLLGTVFSIIAYGASFDYRRPARPVIRLWILWASFAMFLTGLSLGLLDVSAANVPIILGTLAMCLVIPLPILLLERAIGRGAGRSAEKLLASHSVASARASARTSLTFLPGNPEGLTAYGKALAANDKPLQALPYLLYIEKREQPLQPATALALANAWEAAGDQARTIEYLDKLPSDFISPELLDRQVRLWLDSGQDHRALEAMRIMPNEQRRPWRDDYQTLLIDTRDRAGMHELCDEIKADEDAPFDGAVACLKNILSLYPSDTEALCALIDIQKQLKQSETVAALQEELLAMESERLDVRRELVDYYWQRGNKEQLLLHLNRIMLSGHATTDEKVRLVEETYDEGDYLRVGELVEHETDLATNARALAILANALYQGGRADDALERISQARRLGGDERLLQNLDALSAKIRKNVLDSELTDLEEKTKLSPADLDLKFDYLDRLVAAKSADRVVVQLDDLLQAQPELRERVEKEIRVMLSRHGKNRRLMDFLGDLYLRTGDYDKAFELYERRAQGEMESAEILHDAADRILARKPDHPASLLSEAEYFHNKGEGAKALEYFDRLVATGAELTPDVRSLELDAAEKVGDFERAIRAGEMLLENDADNVELLARVGQLALEHRDFDRAIGHLQKAAEKDPDSFDYRKLSRQAVETSKKARMDEIRAALKATPGDRDLLEELGDLHHDFDQLNEAIASYQRAGINDPERRIPKAKQGYMLAKKGLFTDADEILKEADLRSDLPEDEQDKLKTLFFTTAQLMEKEDEHERALELYRRIFRVDAGYGDVVSHVERLQTSGKKKRKAWE